MLEHTLFNNNTSNIYTNIIICMYALLYLYIPVRIANKKLINIVSTLVSKWHSLAGMCQHWQLGDCTGSVVTNWALRSQHVWNRKFGPNRNHQLTAISCWWYTRRGYVYCYIQSCQLLQLCVLGWCVYHSVPASWEKGRAQKKLDTIWCTNDQNLGTI